MTVSAVVVSHGHARELERSLPALAPQVDELVVISNVPGSVGEGTTGARVLENAHPVSFAANVNRGVAETSGELVVISNPDAYPEPGAVAELPAVAEAHARARHRRTARALARRDHGSRALPPLPDTCRGTIWRPHAAAGFCRDPYAPA